jgi:hypothetical protein
LLRDEKRLTDRTSRVGRRRRRESTLMSMRRRRAGSRVAEELGDRVGGG